MAWRSVRALILVISVLLVATSLTAQAVSPHNLMPVPSSVSLQPGGLALDARFGVALKGHRDPRIDAAVERTLQRITTMTGVLLVRTGATPRLVVACDHGVNRIQGAVEDESYALRVAPDGATLNAPTPYGILRGLETFLQLVEQSPSGFVVRAATIEDRPRFPWRGLMIDVCRHWIPAEVVKRNLDAMAAMKLNVFHWHLSEDQGFRVESRLFPRLQGMGSDGLFFTQAEIRDIVRYAAARGIRVIPEFDVPGHSSSWLVGYPELAAGPGPFEIQRKWGVFDPVMDPTNEQVYRFLDKFFGEMAALFPDEYFHIGGDEVNGVQWKANPKIQAFMQRHGLKTPEDLQAHFNTRVVAILKKHGKRVIGWDEILHGNLPNSAVIHSWRGPDSLAQAALGGYSGILSNGYYLDLIWPASRHYLVDPMGKRAADLPSEAKARILGGEACIWAEWVTPETVDSRIWPRMAAIAERLWSPATVTDVPDMYRRLAVISRWLEPTGVRHRANYGPMLDRLADHRPTGALEGVVDILEPVRDYNRGRAVAYTSLSPLNRLVDAARPESDKARDFAQLVTGLLADPARQSNREVIATWLQVWRQQAQGAQAVLDSALLQDAGPVVKNIEAVCALGLRALDALDKKAPLAYGADDREALERSLKPTAEVHLMIAPPIKKLVDAAAGQAGR
ncbi:MAG TPA: family 20 glycosylhydrolase [Vicinamibacterales bacterium]|jgi:hexosaminidase